LNTSKKTIRIAGEDLPAMPVIGKLMKLTRDEILYSIRKYAENVSPVEKSKIVYANHIVSGERAVCAGHSKPISRTRSKGVVPGETGIREISGVLGRIYKDS